MALTGNERVLVTGVAGTGGLSSVAESVSTQDIANIGTNSPSAPTITGGTINGAVIGGTVPAAGTFTALSATTSFVLSPSTTGAISPTGVLTINPTAASTMDNVAIGGTTALAGKFTTLAASTSLTVSADNGLKLTGQTTDAGSVVGTLTNAPTVGDPTFWLRITVNGTNVAVPAWTA